MIRRHPILWSLVLLVICLAVALIIAFQKWSGIPEVEHTSMAKLLVGRLAAQQLTLQGVADPRATLSGYLTSPRMLQSAWKRFTLKWADKVAEHAITEMPEVVCKPGELPGVLNIFATGTDAMAPRHFLNALLDELMMQFQEGAAADGGGQSVTQIMNTKAALSERLAGIERKLNEERRLAAPDPARMSHLGTEKYQIENEQKDLEDKLFKASAIALSGQITVNSRATGTMKFERPLIPPAKVLLTYSGAAVVVAGLIIALAVLRFELRASKERVPR